jgi:hypothetical protein
MILRIIPLLIRCAIYIVGYTNSTQNGSHDSRGVYQSSGFKGETSQSSHSSLEQPERGTKRHKGWPTPGASRAPLRGPGILKLHISVPTERFPSCRPGFPAKDYPQKTHETTWSGFDRGGICPCLVIWRGPCPSWLSPMNSDPGSTQILTRHYGAQSQIISQLESSGTTPTSKSQ